MSVQEFICGIALVVFLETLAVIFYKLSKRG